MSANGSAVWPPQAIWSSSSTDSSYRQSTLRCWRAKAAGVADRVRFQCLDVSGGLPASFDIVTTFDVVHDAVDPLGMLRAIRLALNPDGIYVCLEMTCSERPEENSGPIGTLFHGI